MRAHPHFCPARRAALGAQNARTLSVKYQDLPPLLLNEFLKDHRRVDELAAKQEAEVRELREENAALKKRVGSLESAVMT